MVTTRELKPEQDEGDENQEAIIDIRTAREVKNPNINYLPY